MLKQYFLYMHLCTCVFVCVGLDAFREALLKHLEQNARLTVHQPGKEGEKNEDNQVVSDQQKQLWLSEYRTKIKDYSIKMLVKESVKFRFQCSSYIILIPNWHALREVSGTLYYYIDCTILHSYQQLLPSSMFARVGFMGSFKADWYQESQAFCEY